MITVSPLNFAKQLKHLPIFCHGFSTLSEILDSSELNFDEDETPEKNSLFYVSLELIHPVVDGGSIVSLTFFKNNKAEFTSAETKNVKPAVKTKVNELLKFKGTWEEVTQKTIELSMLLTTQS